MRRRTMLMSALATIGTLFGVGCTSQTQINPGAMRSNDSGCCCCCCCDPNCQPGCCEECPPDCTTACTTDCCAEQCTPQNKV